MSRRRADCFPTHNLQRLMSPRTGGHPPSPRSPTNIDIAAIAHEAWWCLPLERLLSPPRKRRTGSDRCCCARGFAIVLGVNFGREVAERALAKQGLWGGGGKLGSRPGREAAYDEVMVSDLGIVGERRYRW